MGSSGKTRTTYAKLNRESKRRDKRAEKEARKVARKLDAARETTDPDSRPAEFDSAPADQGSEFDSAPADSAADTSDVAQPQLAEGVSAALDGGR